MTGSLLFPTTGELPVADDGVGLPEVGPSAAVLGGHIGLHTRRTRIEAASGRLTFTSPPAVRVGQDGGPGAVPG